MGTGKIPEDPERRRALVVLEDHDVEQCDLDSKGRRFLDSAEVHVLVWPCRGDLGPLKGTLASRELLRPGSVLIQCPFDLESYVLESQAIERFSLVKYAAYSRICAALGARVVEVVQIERQSGSVKTSLRLDGNMPIVSGAKIAGAVEELRRMEASLSLRDEFAGMDPDIARAERILKDYRLRGDGVVSSLIDQRRDSHNPIRVREVRTNLVAETRANLDIVGSLQLPSFLELSSSVGGAVNRVRSDVREFSLTLRVTF